MLSINVQTDITKALAKLSSLEKEQVPFATALALTKTGQEVKKALEGEVAKSFDAPTPFTKASIFLTPARKTRLVAKVWIKDRQVKYLYPEVEGGPRNTKGFESLLRRAGILPAGWFALPTDNAPKNAFGNVPGSVIVRILSQLQASRENYYNENPKAKKKRNQRATKGRYFAILPGRSHLPPGIWERVGTSEGRQARPIFLFTSKTPTYKPRFKFYEVSYPLARRIFPGKFEEALKTALASART